MKITKENYEAFILDYLEGQLSSESQAELFQFLDLHPELAAEFDLDLTGLPKVHFTNNHLDFADLKSEDGQMPPHIDMQLAAALEGDKELPFAVGNALFHKHWNAMRQSKLPAERIPFLGKTSLQVSEVEDFEMWLAALAEGDVADGPLKSAALQDPKLQQIIGKLQSAVLKPEPISFGDVSVLKHEPKVVALFPRSVKYVAVAAACIGAIAWFSLSETTHHSSRYQAYEGQVKVTRNSYIPTEVIEPTYAVGSNVEVGQSDPGKTIETAPMLPRVNMEFAKMIAAKEFKLKGNDLAVQNPLEERTAHNNANESAIIHTVKAPATENYIPLKTLVINKAKSKVLGEAHTDSNEPFVRELSEKIEASIEAKNSERFSIQFPNKKKGQKFYFKMGGLEINKPSGVVEFVHSAGNANG